MYKYIHMRVFRLFHYRRAHIGDMNTQQKNMQTRARANIDHN